MTWAKVDDRFHEHPKLAAAGAASWGMWLAGIAYCNRALTDGFIPDAVAEGLGGRWRVRQGGKTWQVFARCGDEVAAVDADWIAQALVEAGLWHRVEGGYQIHDYADYQPSRDEVMAARQTLSDIRKAAGAKGGAARVANQEASKVQANAKQNPSKTQASGQANAKQSSSPVPVPVPVPEPQPHPFGGEQQRPAGGVPDLDSAPKKKREPKAKPIEDERVAEVFAHWVKVFRKTGVAADPNATADGKKRLQLIASRLGEGYTVEQLKRAIDGCAASRHHTEGGYTDLTLIVRGGEKVDAFEAKALAPKSQRSTGFQPYLEPGEGAKMNERGWADE